MEEDSSEKLIAPLQFFVELSTYSSVHGPPNDGEIAYKKMGSTTLAGVS